MSAKSRIGVIFDCDGTLMDSMEVWHGIDAMLAEKSQVEFTKADQDYFTGATLEECSEYAHRKLGIGKSPQDVWDMIHERMRSYYAEEAVLKPGIMEFVKGLHARGVPMSVASSTSADLLAEGMRSTGLSEYMRTVLSTDDVGMPKRFPHIYDAARDAMGTRTEDTWGVEDALYAVRTLNDAGYNTLAVYDSDIAGTASDLKDEADMMVMTFEGLGADEFIDMATRHSAGR